MTRSVSLVVMLTPHVSRTALMSAFTAARPLSESSAQNANGSRPDATRSASNTRAASRIAPSVPEKRETSTTRRAKEKKAAASLDAIGPAFSTFKIARRSRACSKDSSRDDSSEFAFGFVSVSFGSVVAFASSRDASARLLFDVPKLESTSSARLAACSSSASRTRSSAVISLELNPETFVLPIAWCTSYAHTPTACDRFRDVGPTPPVYRLVFFLFFLVTPDASGTSNPAVGIITPTFANASSSFVKPVASFPNRIATLPSFVKAEIEKDEDEEEDASFASTFASTRHASRMETIGKFSRGRAVVAATKTQSATARAAVSNLPAFSKRPDACTAMIRASSASGAVDRSRVEYVALSEPSSIVASKGGASAPGSGATMRRSVMPKLFITRAMPPTFAGPWGRHSTKHTLDSRETG